MIRNIRKDDWNDIRRIYMQSVEKGDVTFFNLLSTTIMERRNGIK